MEISVADAIAQRRAHDAECAICGASMCAELLEHRRRRDDEFERLRCLATGETFRRVWIAG